MALRDMTLAQQWAIFENQDLHQRLVDTSENDLASVFGWKTEHGVTSGLVFGTRLSAFGPPGVDPKAKGASQVKSNLLHALKASGAQPSALAIPEALDQDLLLVSMGLAELRIWWPGAVKLGLPMVIARLALRPSGTGETHGEVVDCREIPFTPVGKDHPSAWATLWNLAKGAPTDAGGAEPVIDWLAKEGALPDEVEERQSVEPPTQSVQPAQPTQPPINQTPPTEPPRQEVSHQEPHQESADLDPPEPPTEPIQPVEPNTSLAEVHATAHATLDKTLAKADFASLVAEYIGPARERIESRLTAVVGAAGQHRPDVRTRLDYIRGRADLALSGTAADFTSDIAAAATKARETVWATLADALSAAADANPLPEIDPKEVKRTLARRLDAATAQATADRERITAAFDARVAAQQRALAKQVDAEAAAEAHIARIGAVTQAARTATEEATNQWFRLEAELRAKVKADYQVRHEPAIARIIGELEKDLATVLEDSQPPRQTIYTSPIQEDIIDAEVMPDDLPPFDEVVRPTSGPKSPQLAPGRELVAMSSTDAFPAELRLLLAQQIAANQPSRWPLFLAAAGVGAVVVAVVLALVLWLGGGLSLPGKSNPMDDVKAPTETSQQVDSGGGSF
jgi:hypothetical protein